MTTATAMMYSVSLAERTTAFQQIRSTILQKPAVTITLKGESASGQTLPHAFTTRDKIEGEVSIISQFDMRFDDIYITFEGTHIFITAALLTNTNS